MSRDIIFYNGVRYRVKYAAGTYGCKAKTKVDDPETVKHLLAEAMYDKLRGLGAITETLETNGEWLMGTQEVLVLVREPPLIPAIGCTLS